MDGTSHHLRPLMHRSHTPNRDVSPSSEGAGKHERKLSKPHEHTHHHHHPHLHHHREHGRGRHQREKGVVQSAVQLRPSAPFGELLGPGKLQTRSTLATPSSSQIHLQASLGSDTETENAAGGLSRREQPRYTETDLARKREHRRIRSVELRSSLARLNEISNSTTRRLDDTYYSILEKLSTLQTTISSLQELSKLDEQLLSTFEDEAGALKTEVQSEIDAFGAFEAQASRVGGLQGRMRDGKEKVGKLGQRLEGVRSRVEAWEKKERDWQAKTSRRLRILWSTLTIFLLLFAALLVTHYLPSSIAPPQDGSTEHQRHSQPVNASMIVSRLMEQWKTEGVAPTFTRNVSLRPRHSAVPDDGRLRVFDEL